MKVLVTGAASGFGAGVLSDLRSRGESVRGIDLRSVEDIIVADIRSTEQVRGAVDRAVTELGGLDVLINNAGVGGPVDSGAPPNDHALETLDVNLLGSWRVTAAALPTLLESRGRVINVASALAYVNVPYTAAYCASKRGLAAYSDVLRLEYGDRVGVTTIYPGYVRTPIHARSEALGFSLSEAVPEESLSAVVSSIVSACYSRRPRRDIATTRLTGAGIFFARHFPRMTDAVTRRHVRRLISSGRLGDIEVLARENALL